MYHFRATLGSVDLAFTDRHDGVSAPPWSELNLAVSGGDDDAAKAKNHELLLADFAPGAALADLYQVHGREVAVAEPGVRPECDGIVTDEPDVVLMVRAADCVPVLLADPGAGVVGAAHAGRQGMVRGVVPATVARMREFGATTIHAWIGPHVCGGCYEVPQTLCDEVAAQLPAARATTRWGTPSLDLGAGVRAQLEGEAVRVESVAGCTLESESLYSYRRDGEQAGRQAGVIRIRGGER
ncbi:peptidoglycan editing factor PgeF [Nocardioides insulae]|uniref:peptidoglycan editing factor PgeF n=1 Tax=Nocardioides insulae TaxID=394734 RepID=UPI0003FD94B8|nr:peptidoglycan editing factor PgeF [Nocardioides insulae]